MPYCEECGDSFHTGDGSRCWETGGPHVAESGRGNGYIRPSSATYKGRKYKLLWVGDTKFGRRAHLGFWDGSKSFWVDATLVSNLNR